MSKKSTRQAYGEALVELGKINKDVVVIDADLSGSLWRKFSDDAQGMEQLRG